MSSFTSDTPPAAYVIDISESSITFSWQAYPSASKYIVSIASSDPDELSDVDESGWLTMSRSFRNISLKKKNLQPSSVYKFKYRPLSDSDTPLAEESEVLEGCKTLTVASSSISPDCKVSGSGQIEVSWTCPPDSNPTSYQLNMRTETGPFEKVGAVKGTVVVKKNLDPTKKYHFQVLAMSDATVTHTSQSTKPYKPALTVSKFYSRTFPPTLLSKDPAGKSLPVPLSTVLSGTSTVLLYFSASWCGPCRQFTPNLVSFYREYATKYNFRVVFVSCDRDENSFNEYYGKHMPWNAVPFEEGETERERLQANHRVNGIPRLVVLGGDGKVKCDNGVGGALNEDTAKRWSA
jgi:thiol-disulfide isomerase/thioredoxin